MTEYDEKMMIMIDDNYDGDDSNFDDNDENIDQKQFYDSWVNVY